MRTRPSIRGRRASDRGSLALEAAMLLPVVLSFALMAAAAGRLQTTGSVVDAAARAAARAASLARSEDGARSAAAEAAAQVLGDRRLRCGQDPVGQPVFRDQPFAGGNLRTVTVRVSCRVALRDLLRFDGVPGEKTVTGEFTSVIDRYRGQ
ncbi:TadE/TadG family type IV pilus assembly protein [Kitasatospora terrestris]|uniref:TadE-like domain-containing protein n=1 Tax=Kitasatospora terrestris TaxID=258051 RepID=A0ABP9ECL2_9ACTN